MYKQFCSLVIPLVPPYVSGFWVIPVEWIVINENGEREREKVHFYVFTGRESVRLEICMYVPLTYLLPTYLPVQ